MGNKITKVEKKKVLVDAKVEIDLEPWLPRSMCKTTEQYAEYLERSVRDFKEFLRDHRSQDVNSMSVERIYEDQCSGCGAEYEEDKLEDGSIQCAYCGGVIKEAITSIK